MYTSLASCLCFKTKDFSHECEAKDVSSIVIQIWAPFMQRVCGLRDNCLNCPDKHKDHFSLSFMTKYSWGSFQMILQSNFTIALDVRGKWAYFLS